MIFCDDFIVALNYKRHGSSITGYEVSKAHKAQNQCTSSQMEEWLREIKLHVAVRLSAIGEPCCAEIGFVYCQVPPNIAQVSQEWLASEWF